MSLFQKGQIPWNKGLTKNINSIILKYSKSLVKWNIIDMQKLANSKKGKCLSKKYINCDSKLKWKCSKGHIWKAIPMSIMRGTWCSKCVTLNKKNKAYKNAQNIIKEKKGQCISKNFIDNKTKLKIKCSNGHVWKTTLATLRQGCWCSKCGKYKRIGLEKMKELAKERNGICLSKLYKNNRTKLKWKCSKGHKWKASYGSIKIHWCPICAAKKCGEFKRTGLKKMKELAKEKGGECLSNNYTDEKRRLKWRCSKGHIWKTSSSSIKIGSWCPYCAGLNKKTIKDMKILAMSKEGKCLSKEYINDYTKIKWKCSKGHVWKTSPGSIKQGSWCPKCVILSGKDKAFKKVQNIIKEKKGTYLSDYINNKTKLKIKCFKGHIWYTTPNALSQGKWCLYCSSFKTENFCRKIFEDIFKVKFEKIRPNWLRISNYAILELDGFNDSIETPIGKGLAFEYNGMQHYQTVSIFKTHSMIKRKKYDEYKIKKCQEQNIILIIIPYTVKYNKIKEYIINKLKNKHIIK